VVVAGKGEIGEHNDINFSNATIVATYFSLEVRQKRALIIKTKISSFSYTFLGQHSLI
jgi:hypothetical protein